MNTLEEFKALVAAFQTDKTIENALHLGNALHTLRGRTVKSENGDLVAADMSEAKLLSWFKISGATARRLKLLVVWKREVLAQNPGSLTDAYRITEDLHKAELLKADADVNRGGRPRKSDVERSLEFLILAAEHWLASERPKREFVDRARMAIEN